MNTLFLVCFILGLVLSLLAAFTGGGRLHFGHPHTGHLHAHTRAPGHIGVINGFTLPAFLCWFGGAGYLLHNFSPLVLPLLLLISVVSGLLGASVLYAALFKLLLPNERPLTAEDTRMEGVVARVSDEIRANGGVGEIIFSQVGTRRSAAARSESGEPLARHTEVVVLRYVRGVAYVAPLHESMLREPMLSTHL